MVFFLRSKGSRARDETPAGRGAGPPRSWEVGFIEFYFGNKTRPGNKGRSAGTPDEANTSAELDPLSLSLVMSLLAPFDLARAQAVSKQWCEVASWPEVRRESFKQHWGLSKLSGEPRAWPYWQAASLRNFVREHTVSKEDTLPMLAVKYATDVITLKRINNMTTDHSLHSRQHIFVPVTGEEEVRGHHGTFRYCPVACREVLVMQPVQGQAAASAPRPTQASGTSPAQSEARTCKLAQLLARSLHVDEGTARFYLDLSDGCVKKALALAQQDAHWEQGLGTGRSHALGLLGARGRAGPSSLRVH